MKKILYIALLALCAGGFLGGCKLWHVDVDWNAFNYYVWENNSSHSITISSVSPEFDNVVLTPGEKYEDLIALSGYYNPPGENWRITLLFDDDPYGVEFYEEYYTDEEGYGRWCPMPEEYDMRYNPVVEENYAYEEVKNPNGCRECPGHRWTYTFTDDDYQAAVEYASSTSNSKSIDDMESLLVTYDNYFKNN